MNQQHQHDGLIRFIIIKSIWKLNWRRIQSPVTSANKHTHWKEWQAGRRRKKKVVWHTRSKRYGRTHMSFHINFLSPRDPSAFWYLFSMLWFFCLRSLPLFLFVFFFSFAAFSTEEHTLETVWDETYNLYIQLPKPKGKATNFSVCVCVTVCSYRSRWATDVDLRLGSN